MLGELQLFNQSAICVDVNVASVRSALRSPVVLRVIRPVQQADTIRILANRRDDLACLIKSYDRIAILRSLPAAPNRGAQLRHLRDGERCQSLPIGDVLGGALLRNPTDINLDQVRGTRWL